MSAAQVRHAPRHAVVTGGGTGVGLACARRLAEAGMAVTVMGRRAEPLKATGLPWATCDVTDPEAVNAAFDLARAERGPITVVVANAGAAESAPFAKTDRAALDANFAVNCGGVFSAWQAALADMKAEGWGRMIAVASTAGLKGYPYVAPYCAAKHAVVGLTRALALELARSGITVNAICPGFVETPLLERSIENIMATTGRSRDEAARSLTAANPQRRFIQPAEVAEAAAWLASDGSAAMNGHALSLSGGEI